MGIGISGLRPRCSALVRKSQDPRHILTRRTITQRYMSPYVSGQRLPVNLAVIAARRLIRIPTSPCLR